MPIIKITVKEKHATLVGAPMIVCDNTDYSVKFTFDDGWGANTKKTARFAWVADGKRQHADVIFTGDTVAVPALVDTWEVFVGVFEGDLCTTTPARIYVERSIRSHSGQPAEQQPGQYDHIMVLFQQAADNQAQAAENAQKAQDGAQRAENAAVNVEAIVAGNEAYTKTENDRRDAPAIVESAIGAAIVVEDAADRPLHSLVLRGKATQAAAPTPDAPVELVSPSGTLGVKVCGKNMLHYPYSEGSMTRKGITFTVNEDGTIKATGTSTGAYILLVTKAEKQVYLSAGKTYTLSGVPAGGGMDTYYAYVATDDKTFFDTGTGVTLTPQNSGYVSVTAVIKEGVTVNGLKFKPQLELAGAASDFVPYQGQALSYELPGKFAAGTLDCMTGELHYGTIIDVETTEWGPGRSASGWVHGFDSIGQETMAFHHHLGAEKADYYPPTLCSHFPAAATWAEIVSGTTEMAYRGNAAGLAYVAIRIKRSRLTEYGFVDDGTGETAAAAFIAWLEAQAAAGTPVQFVGEIENTAQLVGAVSANTYKLTTTVLNDEGLDMDLEYVVDTKAYIAKTYPSFEEVAF